jgi:hypothetical protein
VELHAKPAELLIGDAGDVERQVRRAGEVGVMRDRQALLLRTRRRLAGVDLLERDVEIARRLSATGVVRVAGRSERALATERRSLLGRGRLELGLEREDRLALLALGLVGLDALPLLSGDRSPLAAEARISSLMSLTLVSS